MTVWEYHKAGNSEAQQKQALAYLFDRVSLGKATTGVLDGLSVAQTTTASGSVVVSGGAGIVQAALVYGASLMMNDGPVTLDVLGENPMGAVPRNDIVVLNQQTASIDVIVGTPNAVPTDPTVQAWMIPLGRLRHGASATTIPAAKIDDLRTFTGLAKAGPDTGWINLPIVPGGWTTPTGTRWQARRLGKVVYFRGTLQNSSFSGFATICTLPTGIPAPPAAVALPLGSNTSASRYITVEPSGVVEAYSEGASSAFYHIGGSYLVD